MCSSRVLGNPRESIGNDRVASRRIYTNGMRPSLFVFVATALVGIALAYPSPAPAQSLDGAEMSGSGEPFSISVRPQYPAPFETATVSFLPGSVNLANAIVSVSADGKNIHNGPARPVAVPLGRAGSVTSVNVTVSSAGATYRRTVSIRPQDVALIAEPLSSVPPLYPGGALVAPEGKARIVAVANLANGGGASLDPSALAYVWTVGGVRMANSSGIGKNAIIVASPLPYRATDVSVAVMSQDGSLAGGAELSLMAAEPFVRIYENAPLLGIRSERALSGTYDIKGAESALYAAPFGLPTTGGAPLLTWFIDGERAQEGNLITLRPSGKGVGRASLSFVASAGAYASASANLSLSFGATSSGFFGL